MQFKYDETYVPGEAFGVITCKCGTMVRYGTRGVRTRPKFCPDCEVIERDRMTVFTDMPKEALERFIDRNVRMEMPVVKERSIRQIISGE